MSAPSKPKPTKKALADQLPAIPEAETDARNGPALADEQDVLRLETTEEELTRLERMLTRAKGFTLAFARVNAPTQRTQLVEELRTRVQPKSVEIVEIDLDGSVENVLTEIEDYLRQHDDAAPDGTTKQAVFVYGLEQLIPSSAIYHPALALINLRRENFREAIPTPLVFWIPEYALQAIAEGAPDFWAWRSGVYEFTLPQEHTEAMWASVEPERGQSRLSLLEKKERINSLSGLLAEYELREDKNEPNIVAIRFDLLTRIGDLYDYTGNYELAFDFFGRALALAEATENESFSVHILLSIGIIYQKRGNHKQALAHYERSLKIAEETGNRSGVAISQHQIGMIYRERGNYGQALVHYERSLKINEELGNRNVIAPSLGEIGIIYQEQGDYEQARAHYERSLKIEEETGSRSGIATALHLLGNLDYLRGDHDQALDYYRRSLQINEELGNRYGIAFSHGQLGQFFLERGQYEEAFEHSLMAFFITARMKLPDIWRAIADLKKLRSAWGTEPFDEAWQEATGEPVPDYLIETDAAETEDS